MVRPDGEIGPREGPSVKTHTLTFNSPNSLKRVGTTRSRVGHFMNKFRTRGFVEHADNGALTVNCGLLSTVPSDKSDFSLILPEGEKEHMP